jgi:hypothetical protein
MLFTRKGSGVYKGAAQRLKRKFRTKPKQATPERERSKKCVEFGKPL